MYSIKERALLVKNELKTECCTTMVKIAAGDPTAFSKGDRATACAASAIAAGGCASAAVFGADIIGQITSMLSTYYTKIAGIATLLAAFCILIALLWAMISPSPQGAQTPIGWVKKILIFYILILSLGGIITLIENLTSGMAFRP